MSKEHQDIFHEPPPTPRSAVEWIFRNTEMLMRFISTAQDAMDLVLEISQVAHIKAQKGESDLGEFTEVVEEAEKIKSDTIILGIDAGAYGHGLGTVRLLTAVEVGVDEVVVELWKRNGVPESVGHATSEKEMRALLRKKKKAKNFLAGKKGIDRFEALLSLAGLSGEVTPELRDAIRELAATRHILVHRSGVPDEDFFKQCPDVPIWGNGVIRVTKREFVIFVLAVYLYMAELMVRLREKGWMDGELETDWPGQRDGSRRRLAEAMAKPRAQPTGSGNDILIGFDEFNERMDARKERRKKASSGSSEG